MRSSPRSVRSILATLAGLSLILVHGALPAQAQKAGAPSDGKLNSGPMPDAVMPTLPSGQPSGKSGSWYRAGDALRAGNDGLVGIVEGRNIRIQDVADAIAALPPDLKAQELDLLYPMVLEELVNRAVILNVANQENFDVDPDVRRRMKTAADRELEAEYLDHLIAGQVTEDAIRARYQKRYAGRDGIPEMKIRVILVRTPAEAEDVIAALNQGADFATLARVRSMDFSGRNGGELGFVRAEDFSPVQAEVLASLAPGQHSSFPVRERLGWSVVQLDERRLASVPTFDQAHDVIKRELNLEAASTVVTRLRAETRVRRFNMDGTPLDENQIDKIDASSLDAPNRQ